MGLFVTGNGVMMRLWGITAVILSMAARAAIAQPANAEAEALFNQGVTLMDAGQLAEACAAFEGSEQRSPAITTLLNLATCRERNGQLATAWGAYVEAERETRSQSDATAQTLHTVAKDHAAKLEPRLSQLTINVAHRVAGLTITRDAATIDESTWNRTLPVDGGNYTITAHAPGYVAWKATICHAPPRRRNTRMIR